MTLFDQDGGDLDPTYLRLRDTDDASDAEQKAYLDGLWTRARPHLDGNFKSVFARNTAQRFWELRLAVAFLDLGYALDAGGEGRPDLATRDPAQGRDQVPRSQRREVVRTRHDTAVDACLPQEGQEERTVLGQVAAIEAARAYGS